MRFGYIQILRLLAAVSVVGFHAISSGRAHLVNDAIGPMGVLIHGYLGVDLFFVISGFIICHTSPPSGLAPLAFLRRRIWRIAPLYWLATLAFVAALNVAPGLSLQTGGNDAAALLRSLLFASFTEGTQPVVSLGWSLEFEMIFYVCVAGLALLRGDVWDRAIGLFGALVLAKNLGWTPDGWRWPLGAPSMLLEFTFGIVAARLFARRAPSVLSSGLVLAAIVAIVWNDPASRVLVAGLSSAAAVLLAASFGRDGKPLPILFAGLERLGDATYSIYLAQVFTIPLLARATAQTMPDCPVWAFMAIAIVGTVAAGWALYRCVERPLLHGGWGRRVGVQPP